MATKGGRADVTEVFEAAPQQGSKCWYTKVGNAEAVEFIDAVQEHMAEVGRDPTFSMVADKLKGWGVPVTGGQAARHLRRRCRCYR